MLIRPTIPKLRQSVRAFIPRGFSTAPLSNGITLAYDLHEPPAKQDANDAVKLNSPIIFIHGLFGSKKNNRSISKVLARDLHSPVYALDLRNHGDSSHHPRHDYNVLAEDVELFLRSMELENSTIIGHSMGAKTAMTVALRQNVRIANLIPVDNAPVDAALKSDFGKYMQGMRKIEASGCTKQSEADAILQEYEEALPIRQFLLSNLMTGEDGKKKFRIPIHHLAPALDNMADFPFKDPDEARFSGPTLMVRGTKSRYVADEMLPIIGRFFPKFEVVDVESGHWVISEKPEDFRRAVIWDLDRTCETIANSRNVRLSLLHRHGTSGSRTFAVISHHFLRAPGRVESLRNDMQAGATTLDHSISCIRSRMVKGSRMQICFVERPTDVRAMGITSGIVHEAAPILRGWVRSIAYKRSLLEFGRLYLRPLPWTRTLMRNESVAETIRPCMLILVSSAKTYNEDSAHDVSIDSKSVPRNIRLVHNMKRVIYGG
nr:abhydrolase domain-containing protein c22h12.03 [Quercus suber]